MAQDRNPAVWPHFDKSKVPYVNEHICQCWWGRWWWWWSIRKPSAPTYLYLPGRIVSFKSSPLFSSLLFFSGGYISFKSSGRRFVSFLFFLLKHVHPLSSPSPSSFAATFSIRPFSHRHGVFIVCPFVSQGKNQKPLDTQSIIDSFFFKRPAHTPPPPSNSVSQASFFFLSLMGECCQILALFN